MNGDEDALKSAYDLIIGDRSEEYSLDDLVRILKGVFFDSSITEDEIEIFVKKQLDHCN